MKKYLEILKTGIDTSIINRGQKIYLTGGVSALKNSALPSWFNATVYDQDRQESFNVKFPDTMELLNYNENLDLHLSVLQDFSTCNCPYFESYGLCRHIVSVGCRMDQDKGLQTSLNNTKKIQKHLNSILDTVQITDIQKKSNNWLLNFEKYLEGLDVNLSIDLTQVSTEYAIGNYHNELDYFWEMLQKVILTKIKDYDTQKLIAKLIRKTLITNTKIWATFWFEFFKFLHENIKYELFLKIILDKEFEVNIHDDLMIKYLKINLEEDEKQRLIDLAYSKGYDQNKIIKISFALNYSSGIVKFISSLSLDQLFELLNIDPSLYANIEPHLVEYLEQWANFVEIDGYEEFTFAFSRWQKYIGKTESYIRTFEKACHINRKKTKLITLLKKI